MKIGIALSGGGARGIAHIGVLKALDEMGIKFSMISGTSAGSIVASLYAYGYRPDDIYELVKDLTIFKSLRLSWTGNGILTLEALKELLKLKIPENNFSALKIPLVVAATEMHQGRIHYFKDGELIPAVMASCSIPAIFTPVDLNGKLYADGGMIDNLPVAPIRPHCDIVVGSHCNQLSPEFDLKSMKAVVERTFLIAISVNTMLSRTLCDVFIDPPAMDRFAVFDIGMAKEIFDAGYHYTKINFMPYDFQKPKKK
jgi:NTE family protein